jgi:hypothetical protein
MEQLFNKTTSIQTKLNLLYKLWFFCLIKSKKYMSADYFHKFRIFFENKLGKLYLKNNMRDVELFVVIQVILIDPMVQQTTMKIPLLFFTNIKNIIKSWNVENLLITPTNHGNKNYYVDNILLVMFAKYVKEVFNENEILDIGSGTGSTLNIIKTLIKNKKILIPSDPIHQHLLYPSTSNKKNLNALEALKFYKLFENFTIMSPPPTDVNKNTGIPLRIGGGFEVIFIEELIKQLKKFTILIIGEIGAGDGISGAHNYLFYNKNIKTTILYIHEIEDKFNHLDCRKTKMIYLVKSNY